MIAVLLSGGIDSAVCLLRALDTGSAVVSMAIDYNQEHRAELPLALGLADAYHVPHKLLKAECFTLGEVADNDAMVFPHRNAVFLTMCAAYYEPDEIWIGCNANDQEDYIDCRPLFLSQMSEALSVDITAPLLALTKTQIVQEAIDRGIDLELTLSCYRGTRCGTCNACRLRSRSIREAARI